VQRSVRVAVATLIVLGGAGAVAAAVAAQVAVSSAAVAAAVGGVVASRIVATELKQTRQTCAADRAEQARGFGTAMKQAHREHVAFTAVMGLRLEQAGHTLAVRDSTIAELEGTLRLADLRIAETERLAERECARADDAEHRLSTLLDEVLTQPQPVTDPSSVSLDGELEAAELPTIVDMLAWEERTTQAAAANRAQAANAELRRNA